ASGPKRTSIVLRSTPEAWHLNPPPIGRACCPYGHDLVAEEEKQKVRLPARRKCRQAPRCLLQARLKRGDVVGAHGAGGRHFALLDPPQAERPGDVAVLVEADRPDDAFVPDRLARFDQP